MYILFTNSKDSVCPCLFVNITNIPVSDSPNKQLCVFDITLNCVHKAKMIFMIRLPISLILYCYA